MGLLSTVGTQIRQLRTDVSQPSPEADGDNSKELSVIHVDEDGRSGEHTAMEVKKSFPA